MGGGLLCVRVALVIGLAAGTASPISRPSGAGVRRCDGDRGCFYAIGRRRRRSGRPDLVRMVAGDRRSLAVWHDPVARAAGGCCDRAGDDRPGRVLGGRALVRVARTPDAGPRYRINCRIKPVPKTTAAVVAIVLACSARHTDALDFRKANVGYESAPSRRRMAMSAREMARTASRAGSDRLQACEPVVLPEAMVSAARGRCVDARGMGRSPRSPLADCATPAGAVRAAGRPSARESPPSCMTP